MRLRGIRERIVYAYNPLPAQMESASGAVPCTDRNFAILSGFPMLRQASTQPSFRYLWQYGGGLERETLLLEPGAMHELRESEGQEFLREFRELGLVLLADPRDADHVRERSLEGLVRAHDFWEERGRPALIELQMRHQFSEEQMRTQRLAHWVYYLNEKKAELMAALRDQLLQGEALPAAGAPSAPAIEAAKPVPRRPKGRRAA